METAHDLPDRTICRTELYSLGTKGLYVCKVENSFFCKYSLSFGYTFYFCHHDDREEMADCCHGAVAPTEATAVECGCATF